MASLPTTSGISEKIALELLDPWFKTRGSEIPKLTTERIRDALRAALRETVKAYNEDETIDFMTAVKIYLRLCVQISSKERGPFIIVVPEDHDFKKSRANPLKVLLIQPIAPKKEHFVEKVTPWGRLFVIRPEHNGEVRSALRECLKLVRELKPEFTCLPELHFTEDKDIQNEFAEAAFDTDSFIVAGSFHDERKMSNVCLIFCPDGKIVEQRKFYRSKEYGEGIRSNEEETLRIINFGLGKFCALICIDSEAEMVRDVLKERLLRCKCPELVFNPSFTEAQDRAYAQLDNLMSLLFAATVFCNASAKGGSCVLYPDVALKKDKFKICELDCSPNETVHALAILDIAKLQAYKLTQIKCLVAMKT